MICPASFKRFLTLIAAFAVTALVISVVNTKWTASALTHILIFGILAVASESFPVTLPKGGFVTVSYAIFYSTMILFPGGVALSVSALGGLLVFGKAANGKFLLIRVFNTSRYILSQTVAQFILKLAGIGGGLHLKTRTLLIYIAVSIIYTIINIVFGSIGLGLLQNKSAWSIWSGNICLILPSLMALAPVGYLMAFMYYHYGLLGLFLLYIPLLASYRSFKHYINIRESHLNTVEALVQALEAKDKYTSGHSTRVEKLSVIIAKGIGMTENKIEILKYAAILHDVGKIGVSDTILNKEGKLCEVEWYSIRSHPVIGQKIIKSMKFMFDIGQVVRHHHERYDGKGYPDGIKGEEIPIESRIIAVADTYDAITSNRSYRKGKPHDEAIEELKRVAGSQLDPQLVEIFCKIVKSEIECQTDYVAGVQMD